jgi:hypothetical protein
MGDVVTSRETDEGIIFGYCFDLIYSVKLFVLFLFSSLDTESALTCLRDQALVSELKKKQKIGVGSALTCFSQQACRSLAEKDTPPAAQRPALPSAAAPPAAPLEAAAGAAAPLEAAAGAAAPLEAAAGAAAPLEAAAGAAAPVSWLN